MKKNRGPELALIVIGEVEKYPAPLSLEQIAGIIQQEVVKGGFSNDDIAEALELLREYRANCGSMEPDSEAEEPARPTMN